MLNKKAGSILVITLTLIITISGCKYSKVKKGTDHKAKLEMADGFYAKEKYAKALTLYEDIVPIYKGTEKGQDVFYKYSYCNYYLKDYILAGYYFRKYAETYPKSKLTEDARFMSAYCYFLDAPKSKLDQETTYRALEEFQLYISKYPNSVKMVQCNELVDKLRDRLEKKSFDNAKLYLDIGYYNAAVIAMQNSLKDFPDTDYREQLSYLIIKASYLYAMESIDVKQNERFEKTQKYYNDFIKKFPGTKYKKEAEKIYADADKYLKQEINKK